MANWKLTIKFGDLIERWKKDELDIPELAELVASRIEKFGWPRLTPYAATFNEVVAGLRKAEDAFDYEHRFEAIYDLADADRVWIQTWRNT